MKELKVYVIDCNETDFEFREAEAKKDYDAIMTEAEKIGSVYSLGGFQEAINSEELILENSFILIKSLFKINGSGWRNR